MPSSISNRIASELALNEAQVAATAALLAEGATVPFIARYRKEATGSLDEVAVTSDPRPPGRSSASWTSAARPSSSRSRSASLLTDELKAQIEAADTHGRAGGHLPALPPEAPHPRHHRQGKGPGAAGRPALRPGRAADPAGRGRHVRQRGEGRRLGRGRAGRRARHHRRERQRGRARAAPRLRELFQRKAGRDAKVVVGKEEDGAKFKDYFDWSEPAANGPVPPHAGHAPRRERRRAHPDDAMPRRRRGAGAARSRCSSRARGRPPSRSELAVQDGYKRLLGPSMETEMRLEAKKRADEEAIRVFADNLRELLLAPPLGQKRVLAIDPGFRTGCKIVCLDRQGKLLHHDVIYPTASDETARDADRRARRADRGLCRSRPSPSATAPPAARPRAFVRSTRLPATISRWSWSTKAAPRSTPPPRSRARSSPTTTSPCAARSPSAGA